MGSYSDLRLPVLLDAFASSAPAPGGGAAAALAGASGVSILVMAARIPDARSRGIVETADAIERLLSARRDLVALIDGDPEAYSRVIEARRLPGHGDSNAARRTAEIASAMRAATDAPLEAMRACCRALAEAPVVAERCARSVHADVAVAIELLLAALRGAGVIVDSNLRSMDDSEYVTLVRAESLQLDSASVADATRARSWLTGAWPG